MHHKIKGISNEICNGNICYINNKIHQNFASGGLKITSI